MPNASKSIESASGWVRPPRNPRELEFAIKRGLGRGLLWAREWQTGKWADAIRRGVLFTGYDSQVDCRLPYLSYIVESLPEPALVLDHLERKMLSSRKSWERFRLYYLLSDLASRDFADSKLRYRRAMRSAGKPTEHLYELECVIWILGWSGLSDWLDSVFATAARDGQAHCLAIQFGLVESVRRIQPFADHPTAMRVLRHLLNPPALPASRPAFRKPTNEEILDASAVMLSSATLSELREARRVLRRARKFITTPEQAEQAPAFASKFGRLMIVGALEHANPKLCREWALSRANELPDAALSLLGRHGQAKDWPLVRKLARVALHPTRVAPAFDSPIRDLVIFYRRFPQRRSIPTLSRAYEATSSGLWRHAIYTLLVELEAVSTEMKHEYAFDCHTLEARERELGLRLEEIWRSRQPER